MWYATGVMGRADPARLRRTVARFDPDGVDAVLVDLAARMPGADATRMEEAFLSERIYAAPAQRSAAAQRAAGGRAWTYRFDWQPLPPHAGLGASHGFDEPFLFGLRAPDRVPLVAGDAAAPALASRMERALVALAHHGDPGLADGDVVFG